MAWAELILHTDYVFSLFWFVLVGTNFYWNPKFESGAGPMLWIERGRKRNAIVPDFKFPGWGAGEETFLAELKGISSNKSRYPRNPRPATRRAAGLTPEYERKARKFA